MSEFHRQGSASLVGASIIITRPTVNATGLMRAVRRRGAEAISLPGVEIRMVDDAETTKIALNAAKSTDEWIFTSPNAVRFCRRLLGNGSTTDWPHVLAVGAGTRRALARHGITATAPRGAQNSEGLLADLEQQSVQGKSITIIDAPGGRDLLAPTLAKRGAQVDRIAVYQRKPPMLKESHFHALTQAPRPWISLVSSSAILNNLIAALPQDLRRRWQQEAIVVSSARLVEQAGELGFSDVHQADSALSLDMLDAAVRVLSRHRL